MALERLDGEKLQVGNRLEGTRREGTQLEGNRPDNRQKMQRQKWQQRLQQQQPQNQVGGGEGGVDEYPEPSVNETQARTWPERDQAAHSRHRDRCQTGGDAPPW